jgi:hypothetical protein
MRGQWIYRDENPLIYWAYMVLFLVADAAILFQLITILSFK